MGLTPAEAADLLGAWALDAADANELTALDAVIGADHRLGPEAAALRDAVARWAEHGAASPPDDLRIRVIGTALASRPAGEPPGHGSLRPVPPVEVLAAQVAQMEAVLHGLDLSQHGRLVSAYGWTVHGLAAHLLAVEQYVAGILGVPGAEPPAEGPSPGPDDHLRLGGDPEPGTGPPLDPFDHIVEAWAARAAATVAHLRRLPADEHEVRVHFHGLPLRRSSIAVVHGFELWTHADDVRRAIGSPLVDPPGGELRTMADRAVRGLPGLLLLRGTVHPPGHARVVLTGDGGGVWDLDLGGGTGPEPVVAIAADVVDWCRFVARRLDADALGASIEGDEHLARELLAAAQSIAL